MSWLEESKRTFAGWLADGESWIGVFQNQDFGSSMFGDRIALCFDDSAWDLAVIGVTRAPDSKTQIRWRYLLVQKTHSADEALRWLQYEEEENEES